MSDGALADDAGTDTSDVPPRRRPVLLVGALVFLTAGVYGLIWMGLNWREIRGRSRVGPVVHALLLLVPVVGVVRVHIHFSRLIRLHARETRAFNRIFVIDAAAAAAWLLVLPFEVTIDELLERAGVAPILAILVPILASLGIWSVLAAYGEALMPRDGRRATGMHPIEWAAFALILGLIAQGMIRRVIWG